MKKGIDPDWFRLAEPSRGAGTIEGLRSRARVAADSVWEPPVPGNPVPLRNLLQAGVRPDPVWRKAVARQRGDGAGDHHKARENKRVEDFPESASPVDDPARPEPVEALVSAHLRQLDDQALIANARDWTLLARPEQLPPKGDWRTWLMLGGRGSGKTRAGAEWVHGLASQLMPGLDGDGRIALVAESFADAREVMIDGISGVLGVAREHRPVFEATRRRLVWPSGAVAQMFSSEDPESLRGPQFDLAWCDELGKWRHARDTWDMLQFGLRLGRLPRQLVTTTPRATPLMLALVKDPATRLTRIRTLDNAANLAAGFLETIRARYGGTRLGRQELDGELIADREDGLWRRDQIEALVVRQHGPLRRIVVAVDPPASGEARHSCCGIVAAGLEEGGRAVVLADGSVEGASPSRWAQAAAQLYGRFDADCVVAEINQGGDMVTSVLRTVEPDLPVRTVRASRGKWLRAEPVAALYEQGRVVHAGHFAALEDQMCDFGPDGLSSGRSPDRLDALVWALTELVLNRKSEPLVRHM
ncbi:terminase family protein [uncultured Hoeflea sp.]|uniref:DNA-packaging protein n=1 Tax=uncultured Hoeflea sp. TaxID=538666 RepID=UPI00263464CA|nr:terminase family protein [uncultured Hoeflea sp.]